MIRDIRGKHLTDVILINIFTITFQSDNLQLVAIITDIAFTLKGLKSIKPKCMFIYDDGY